jgi:isocitrate/isopropylmalate dehydrogenase
MSEAVYTLQNGQNLSKSKFCRYLEKKIKKTSKKFGLKPDHKNIYCLDDAAIDVICSLMNNKPAKTKTSAFLFCLRKELELYAKLRKLKFEFINYSGLKLKIKEMLDSLEEKHKEIKYSILKAQLQAALMS